MIKRIVLFSIIGLTSFQCLAQLLIQDSIIYQNDSRTFIFYKNGCFTELQKNSDIYKNIGFGDDTITYGKYVIYKSDIYLYSDTMLYFKKLPIMVQELSDKKEIYTIVISSPYIYKKKRYDCLRDSYFYLIEITETDTISSMTINKKIFSFSDTILIPKNTGCFLEKFLIKVYFCKQGFFTQYSGFFTFLYFSHKNNNYENNVFFVFCPNFTPMYNYYARYNGISLKIISKKVLIFDRSSIFLRSDCNHIQYTPTLKIGKFLMKNRLDPYEYNTPEN